MRQREREREREMKYVKAVRKKAFMRQQTRKAIANRQELILRKLRKCKRNVRIKITLVERKGLREIPIAKLTE